MKIVKITAFTLLLPMLLFMLQVNMKVIAADTDKSFREAEAVVTYLGGNLFNDSVATRAEFTAALVKLMKIEAAPDNTGFAADIANTEYSDQIRTAASAGIVSTQDKFFPDRAITYYEAEKMLVCAAGYGAVAQYRGGYPIGYDKTARNLGLLKSLKNSGEGFVSKYDAILLLYNILCCDITLTGVKEGTIHYENTDVNYLEKLYGLVCTEGIVTANTFNPEDNGAVSKERFITVENTRFTYKGDVLGLLGKYVYVFSERDEFDAKIVVPANNQEITLSSEDVESISSDSIKVLSKSYDISGARFVYNGRRTNNITLSDLSGDYSEFVLLDNDNDNNYEYVSVHDWKYIYADSVSIIDKSISDANNDAQAFKPTDEDMLFTVYDENNTLIEFDDIKKGTVCAVAVPIFGQTAIIKTCNSKVTGTVEYKNSDNEIGVDGNVYRLSDYVLRNYADKIKPGKECTFLIGLKNDIVAVLNYSDEIQYGYLAVVAQDKGTLAQNTLLKIYTMGGELKIFETDKIKIDTETLIGQNEIYEKLGGSSFKPQLVRYKQNSEGKLTMLDTAETASGLGIKDTDIDNTLKRYIFYSNGAEAKYIYRSGSQGCMPYFNLNSTTVLSVPTDENVEDADASDYSISDRTTLRSGFSYKFEVYDVAENGTAAIVVLRGDSVKSSTNYMVEKIKSCVMPDGSDGKKLFVANKGEFHEIYLGSEQEAQLNGPIKVGDIAEITLNGDNTVRYIDLVFDVETLSPSSKVVTGLNFEGLSNISYWYGAVYYTDGIYAYISKTKDSNGGYDYSTENLINIKVNTSVVTMINKERTEIRPITSAELRDYKSFDNDNYLIVARLNSQAVMEVFAYEL